MNDSALSLDLEGIRTRVRYARKELGLKQVEVAEMIGMSRIAYHRQETGQSELGIAVIAFYYNSGYTYNWLMQGVEPSLRVAEYIKVITQNSAATIHQKNQPAHRLCAARASLGLTQQQVADTCRISKKRYQALERSTHLDIPNNVLCYFAQMGISTDWLLTGRSHDCHHQNNQLSVPYVRDCMTAIHNLLACAVPDRLSQRAASGT